MGYITPKWYPFENLSTERSCRRGTTAAVHAYGRSRSDARPPLLRRHVAELTAQQEESESQAMGALRCARAFVEAMLRGIVVVAFAITRLEGK